MSTGSAAEGRTAGRCASSTDAKRTTCSAGTGWASLKTKRGRGGATTGVGGRRASGRVRAWKALKEDEAGDAGGAGACGRGQGQRLASRPPRKEACRIAFSLSDRFRGDAGQA